MASASLDLKTQIAMERGFAGKGDSSNLTSTVPPGVGSNAGWSFTFANGHLVNIFIHTFY